MVFRKLGGTGLFVSEIGLGCEGFLGRDEAFTQRMFSLAREGGINCMDLYSPDPDMHARIGRAVGEQRSSFIYQAHLCTVWQNGQYKATRVLREVIPSFERMLKNLGTDYVDVGMIHYVDSLETWNRVADGGILEYAQKMQRAGAIGHIGMSSHNPHAALAAVRSGAVKVLMFSVNPCYDLLPGDEDVNKLFEDESYQKPLLNLDPVRAELYETCQRMGVGITVMKAYGGGDLLSEHSPAGVAMTSTQCIHYALTRPAVSSVMIGAHSEEELAAALAYEGASEQERDYAAVLASFPKMSWKGHCMYCGHCAPCPRRIDVATLTKLFHLARAQGSIPETVREHYAVLPSKAGDCIACGACETRCPFGVKVVENMRAAHKLFGA